MRWEVVDDDPESPVPRIKFGDVFTGRDERGVFAMIVGRHLRGNTFEITLQELPAPADAANDTGDEGPT